MHICCCKAFNCDKQNFTSATAPKFGRMHIWASKNCHRICTVFIVSFWRQKGDWTSIAMMGIVFGNTNYLGIAYRMFYLNVVFWICLSNVNLFDIRATLRPRANCQYWENIDKILPYFLLYRNFKHWENIIWFIWEKNIYNISNNNETIETKNKPTQEFRTTKILIFAQN